MAPQPSFNPIRKWKNFHESYEQVIEGEYDLFMPQQSAGLSIEDMQETTRQFQALIADARKKGLKARADRLAAGRCRGRRRRPAGRSTPTGSAAG